MNARANNLHPTQREPIRLDDLASNHYWRLLHLRDLLTHLEEISIEKPTAGGGYEAAMAAMLYSALELVREAAKEADTLNVNVNEFDICLMAMPGELLHGEADLSNESEAAEDWRQISAALQVAAADEATVEDLTKALETVHTLVSDDNTYEADLVTLTRLIELRGYSVGWLSMMGRDNPRVTPHLGMARTERTPPALDDIRASLTAEEIETAARAISGGLEAYLMSALSHPANQGLQVEVEEHETA